MCTTCTLRRESRRAALVVEYIGYYNTERRHSAALFAGGWAIDQLWAFWLAPLAGAACAGVAYRLISGERSKAAGIEGPATASAIPKTPA